MKTTLTLFLAIMLIVVVTEQTTDQVVIEKEMIMDMDSPQRLSYDYYRLASLQLMLEQWRRLAEQNACGDLKWLQRCVPLDDELEEKLEWLETPLPAAQ